MVEKLNASSTVYKLIIIFFSVNLSLVFIFNFYNKETQIQPSGEPREQHLGEDRRGTLKLKYNISNHRNF